MSLQARALQTRPLASRGYKEAMKRLDLIKHPDEQAAPARSVVAHVGRLGDRELAFRFEIVGEMSGIVWPPPAPSSRTDGLWRRTCFEAFVRRPQEDRYVELNYATSGGWAAYGFSGYRTGPVDLDAMIHGRFRNQTSCATIAWWAALPDLAGVGELYLNLSAVIEATDGTRTHWALAHAPGPPDFHNPDCFTARLPAPEAA